MQNVNQTLQQAIALHQQGNLAAAAKLYQQILAIDKSNLMLIIYWVRCMWPPKNLN